MSGHSNKRSLSGRYVALTALVCVGLPCLPACSNGPQTSVSVPNQPLMGQTDPIDGLTPAGKAPVAPKKPAAPTITEAEIGIPYYPGSTAYVAPDGQVDLSSKGNDMTIVMLQTADPVAKVVEFYQQKLRGSESDGTTSPTRKDTTLDGKPVITLNALDGRVLKAAEIRPDDKGTVIELMRMEAPVSGTVPGLGKVARPGAATTTPDFAQPDPSDGSKASSRGETGDGQGMAAPGTPATGQGAIPPGGQPRDRGLKYP